MKGQLINILFIILAVTSACTEEANLPIPDCSNEQTSKCRFVLTTDGFGTRVDNSDELKSKFEDKTDKIGVYVYDGTNGNHIKNTVNTTDGVQTLIAAETGQEIPKPTTEKYYYIFYYPSENQIENFNQFTYSVSANQNIVGEYEKSDFLWCYYKPEDITATTHYITMHHLMAKVIVEIPKSNLNVDQPVKLRNVPLTIKTLNLKDHVSGTQYAITDASREIKMARIDDNTTDKAKYCAVIAAWKTLQTSTNLFQFCLSGSTSTKNYKPASEVTFKEGYCYTFTFTKAASKPGMETTSDNRDNLILNPPVVTRMEPEVMDVNTLKTLMSK